MHFMYVSTKYSSRLKSTVSDYKALIFQSIADFFLHILFFSIPATPLASSAASLPGTGLTPASVFPLCHLPPLTATLVWMEKSSLKTPLTDSENKISSLEPLLFY